MRRQHINREYENVTESPKVQDALDKAKAARRVIIRYIQVVTDETLVGTLLDANEKVVESIQLYDKASGPTFTLTGRYKERSVQMRCACADGGAAVQARCARLGLG